MGCLPLHNAGSNEPLPQGTSAFHQLPRVHGWVFCLWPQREQPSQIDRYLVCGESYRVLRDAVGKAMLACKMEGIAAAQGVRHSSESTVLQPKGSLRGPFVGQQGLTFRGSHKLFSPASAERLFFACWERQISRPL